MAKRKQNSQRKRSRMTYDPYRRGRPSISKNCSDCARDPKIPEEEEQPKRYGAYCAEHMYKRQKASQIKRSMRRPVVLGLWAEIPESVRSVLSNWQSDNIKTVYRNIPDERHAATAAFEFACVDLAIGLGRRITPAEENRVIEAYGGSRTGTDIYASSVVKVRIIGPPLGRGVPAAFTEPPVELAATVGPVLLPNPTMRLKHRAGMLGGPTTVGEPSFEEYYLQANGQWPSDDLRENRPTSEVVASDGTIVLASALEDYERALAKGWLKGRG